MNALKPAIRLFPPVPENGREDLASQRVPEMLESIGNLSGLLTSTMREKCVYKPSERDVFYLLVVEDGGLGSHLVSRAASLRQHH